MDLGGTLAATPAWLILGLSEFDAAFRGGTLVPAPALIVPLVTDAEGALSLSTTWPVGLPPGLSLWLQAWIPDAGGPQGWAASNAVVGGHSLSLQPDASADVALLGATWHCLGTAAELGVGAAPASAVGGRGDGTAAVASHTLLAGVLDEPLLLVRRADGELTALSNVCTHRAALLCADDREARQAGEAGGLRCPYHGRRLRPRRPPAGRARLRGPTSPRTRTSPPYPVTSGAGWCSSRCSRATPSRSWPSNSRRRSAGYRGSVRAPRRTWTATGSWRPTGRSTSRNYLEGLHVPFVHPDLAQQLDASRYRTETARWSSVQLGVTSDEGALVAPAGAPGAGARLAGLYVHAFPTTMLNAYPWGLSINLVQPLGPTTTRVRYRGLVWDEQRLGLGAGADLDRVEREDQAIVRRVQRGSASGLARAGRLARGHEDGVRWFRELLGAQPSG